ncbi:neutral zinc metallopeptidase [Saccharomonospora sp. NPDC046836]|uniref:neutral zinc metallopeptidase n=1 Tax=Saccharomonospora sp. NPDC046836 TaxID=3156921 RepID=UPI0033F925D9
MTATPQIPFYDPRLSRSPKSRCTVDIKNNVRRAKKSPFVIFGVLALVVGIVVINGFAGRAAKPVDGVAMPPPDVKGDTGVERSAPRGKATLPGANSLLESDVHLSAVTCELPELGSTEPQLRGFYTATLTCLDAAWQPALAGAGSRFVKAGLEVASEAANACGEMPSEQEATAFYCESDESIYMPTKRLINNMGLYRPAHLSVLAHEYGHHVQKLTGTLDAGSDLEQGSPGELQESRRVELQANCFAGLFLEKAAGRGAISADDAKAAVDDFRNTYGSDTHGTMDNQIRWAQIGFGADGPAACNTWNTSAQDVA